MDNATASPSRKILVVDDDESVRDLCALVLRTAGYTVETAVHGADGLYKLRQARFDLVITDINMPELSGLEFYASALNDMPAVEGSFLFMTGGAPEELLSALSEKSLKCLEKPFKISELLDTVEGLMQGPLRIALMPGEGGSRKEGRVRFTDDCAVVSTAGVLRGVMRDISPHGMRARYAGEAIRAGENVLVKVSLNGLTFEKGARAVWTEQESGGFVSGIEFSQPMPASSIVNIQSNQG